MVSLDSDFDYETHLADCANGDHSALHRLYERDSRWLMGVALRIVRRRELADEVLHDAFLKIWQRSSTYNRSLGSARGWIFTVVRHSALAAVRKYHHEIYASETILEDLPADNAGASNTSSRSDIRALHYCLERLDEQKRACILLAYIDGFSQSQIAARLNSPLGTVKAWTRRGLLLLRECLS